MIIFVTAHYKYAADAYELDIFRYVPKNQLPGRLARAVSDAASISEPTNRLSEIIWSGADIVDAIVNHTAAQAEAYGITMDVNIEFPRTAQSLSMISA